MKNNERRYVNQKHVRVEPARGSKSSSCVNYNREALGEAMRALTHGALKLYLYLGEFRNEKAGFYLSKQDAIRRVGMTEKTYFNALKELKECGYLQPEPNSLDPHAYVFYEKLEIPPTDEEVRLSF